MSVLKQAELFFTIWLEMNTAMSFNNNYPTQYESWLTLKNGSTVFLRPILHSDEHLVIDLFKRLSPDSVYMRFLRHLHSLPEDMVYQFTHINYSSEFALVAIIEEDEKGKIIAIARYTYSPNDNITDLAIAVRDDWQHLGLGKPLLKKIIQIGKEHGIFRFGGMIAPQNRIIRQILLELGYKVNYSMRSGFFQVEILV